MDSVNKTTNAIDESKRVLQIAHDSIRVFNQRVPFNKTIADGYWHFIALTLMQSSRPILILNGQILYTGLANIVQQADLSSTTSVLSIGSVYNESSGVFDDTGFVGQFSKLAVFNKQYQQNMFNCSYHNNGKKLLIRNQTFSTVLNCFAQYFSLNKFYSSSALFILYECLFLVLSFVHNHLLAFEKQASLIHLFNNFKVRLPILEECNSR